MSSSPGTILGGRFMLGGTQIARFETGEVRLARDLLASDRPIQVTTAIRTPEGFGRSREALEAAASGGHVHPHILAVLGSGEEPGMAWIATDWSEIGSLRDWLERHGRLEPAEAIRCARQMLAALAHVHDQGAVHGNLAPSRVLLDAAGNPWITDFPERDLLESSGGAMVITAAYAAPARIEGGAADAAGDLWAVGVILYEMLTGERPFGGTSFGTIRRKVLTATPLPPSHLAPLPAAFDTLLARALARDPAARFPDARAFDAVLAATVP
ncbi:MAG TPA: serine/threonine-protein kinase [Acetobacteraceae bacterium]|nr:serine/threonine-protein kinase [Acetobacteraceae bacterium]